MVGFCGGSLASGSPWGHVLRLTQSGAVAESAVGVDGMLGATKPVMFLWLLHGESLVPVV